MRLERQRQMLTNHRVEVPMTPEDPFAAPLAAVKLAESGGFSRLLVALALRPRLARAADAFGMTALHWVCSEPTVSARVVLTVARAHPAAAVTRNLAGLVPLHLAVKKRLALEVIQALLHVYPKAIGVRTPDGKTSLMLADQRPESSSAVLALLQALEAHARLGVLSTFSKPEQEDQQQQQEQQQQYPSEVVRDPTTSEKPSTSRSFTQEETLAAIMTPHAPPPRWALASRCRLCAAKFGYFRKRHHCRSCGASVCGRHSRHCVPLTHLGLFQPQRVCECCFDELQKELNVRALERVTRTGGAYPYIDDSDSSSIYSTDTMSKRARYRRRSKSVYSEPTQRQGPTGWRNGYDNGSDASTNGFTPVSAPWNWTASSPEAVESLQPKMGSMFLSVAPVQQTVLVRQRLLRERQESCMELEPAKRRSRQRRSRPHSSALDKSLHVQRLSEVDSGRSSDEQEIEQRMQQLVAVKHELGEAVRCSEEKLSQAEREKLESDAIANKYRRGCLSPSEDEEEDEEAEIAATLAFLNGSKRMNCTSDLLEELESPLVVAATHHKLGESLLSNGNYMRAVVELRRSVELDDNNAVAWLHLAKALDGLGTDSEAAEEAIRRALELEPASIGALSLLGKLLHLRGDHDDAILVFRQALKLQCPNGDLSIHAAENAIEQLSVTT